MILILAQVGGRLLFGMNGSPDSSLLGLSQTENLLFTSFGAYTHHVAEPISGVVFWSKGLATVSHDGKLRLWDRRGIQIDLIEGYGKFNAVAAHRSSVYAASEDGRLIKYQRGKAVVVDQQDSPLKGVCVNPDGLIASVSASGKVKLFFNEHDAPFVLDTGIPLTCMDFGSDVLFAGTVSGKAEVFKKF